MLTENEQGMLEKQVPFASMLFFGSKQNFLVYQWQAAAQTVQNFDPYTYTMAKTIEQIMYVCTYNVYFSLDKIYQQA